MSKSDQILLRLLVASQILIMVALSLGLSKARTFESDIIGFEKETVHFEQLCLDPADPLITPKDINKIRERIGLQPVPESVLARIRTRLALEEIGR